MVNSVPAAKALYQEAIERIEGEARHCLRVIGAALHHDSEAANDYLWKLSGIIDALYHFGESARAAALEDQRDRMLEERAPELAFGTEAGNPPPRH